MNSLSEENQLQLQKYLRFFRQKRDGLQRLVAEEFRDAKNDRADEDVFTKEDFMDFVDSLSGKVKSCVSGEVTTVVNMGALLISQLLESAEIKGVSLDLDLSSIENQSMLEAVEQMSLSGTVRSKGRAGELTSFRDEAKFRQEESKAMRDEADRLENSNKTLQERFLAAQSDASRLMREKSALANEVADLRRRLEAAERANETRFTGHKSDEDSRSRILQLQEQLEEAREECNKKVQESTQFKTMMQVMQKKSSELTELRYRLQRYEPDDCKEDEVDRR